ncbi:hypothetical protein T492DRAFT_854163, partial [Pavlovales sp. CCMP2436]
MTGPRHHEFSEYLVYSRNIKAAVALLSKGKFSDAAKLLESHGLADISDPVVLQQMLTKHPRRRTAMPPVIPGLDATDRLVVGISEMQESYRGLKTDKAQGARGLTKGVFLNKGLRGEIEEYLFPQQLGVLVSAGGTKLIFAPLACLFYATLAPKYPIFVTGKGGGLTLMGRDGETGVAQGSVEAGVAFAISIHP